MSVWDVPAAEGRLTATRAKAIGWVLLAVVVVGFPFVITNPTWTSIGVFALIFMGCTTAWNLFSGFSGYISLGHGVFFGVGAYTIALLANHLGMSAGYGLFALVPLAGLVATLVSIPFAMVSLRTRRRTFIVITLAIFWLFQLAAYNLGFTGGAAGLQLPTPTWSANAYNLPFYFASAIVLVFAWALALGIRYSRFGLQLLAIRDDEDRASGVGVRVWPVKMSAFMLSAFLTGMGGALWAYFVGQIFPQFAFDPIFSVSVTLMAFFGGIGTLAGPILGAMLLESIQQYLSLQFSNGSLYLVIFGGLFLLVLLFMPKGVVPGVGQIVANRRQRRLLASQGAPALDSPELVPPALPRSGSGT